MFSGIIEEAAIVRELVKEQENLHITLGCSFVTNLR
jgi:riboflavin synthase